MAIFGVIFRKQSQFSQCIYTQCFRVAKNHSHKKAIAKGCIPEIEGMQPFSVYVLIFNELRSP